MHILTNAKIHTLDPNRPQASALLIHHGRILAIGTEADCRESGRDLKIEDLGGQTVIPGLTDAHLHLQHYALSLQRIDCETPTRVECIRRVAEQAAVAKPDAWLFGHGWNQNLWPEGFGDAALLDQVAPQQPVYLTAKSLHAGWANSTALRAAGISANTPNPHDGLIQRQPSGQPTGILLEGAMRLVADIIPPPSIDAIAAAIQTAQEILWAMGLTGVHDFDRRDCFTALQRLQAHGKLKLRVLKNLPLDDLAHALALGLRSGFGDSWLRIGGIKAFADGALGPHTAAMLAPYEQHPHNRGMLLLDAEQLYEIGRQAAGGGLSMTVHAIGDLANHAVLNAFEQLRQFEAGLPGQGLRRLRHRIEHVQLLHPQDVARLAQLGVIASMQPIHATSDMLMADAYWGPRAALSYAWRSQLEQGAVLAFGSDAPVESPNPFWGLHAAVTRQRTDGAPGPQGWYPEQRLSLMEALQAYTSGAAYAAGMENQLGRLAPGYLADLLLLDTDPFTCPPEQLHSLAPIATMVGGEWVYQRNR